MSLPYLTVSICTYNRAASLAGTLESLAASKGLEQGKWEVLVVDNNSWDGTAEVVESYADKLPLRRILEPAQGLSNARNCALRECRGELLLFTDDDVIVDVDWAGEYVSAAERFPQAEYFGGRILPSWPEGKPRWLRDEGLSLLEGLLVRYDVGNEVRKYLQSEPAPYGASFALRRSLFEKLEPFRADLGVRGDVPARGEEAEYLGRAVSSGAAGVYVGTALCHHKVDPERLTLRYLYRYGMEKGIAAIRIHGAAGYDGSVWGELRYALRGIAQLGKGRGDRFRQCVINMGIQHGIRSEKSD
jgi:GT2 family glycosyltransferase